MTGPRRAFLAVLAASLAVNAWGITWGLPSAFGWAPDEVLPAMVREAAGQAFAHGWHGKYPPLHFALLALVQAPLDAPRAMLAGRMVSLLMASGLLVVLHRTAERLVGPRAAVLAAALLAGAAPFVYYAKVANLDVPYLFWFTVALFFFTRALEGARTKDVVLFALAAAASVATKDQAWALYPLPAVVLAVAVARAKGGARAACPVLLAGAGAGLLALAVLDNVLLNPGGFLAHLRLITGPASRDFRMYPASPAGEAVLAWQTVRHVRFALGWPSFLVCLGGLALAVHRRPARTLLASLAFPASYALLFLAVVLYAYDRFVLPIVVVLALFGGLALDALWRSGVPGRLAAGLVLACGLAYGLSVDVLMARDARYEAERWLARNASPVTVVAAVGPLEYLPRLDGLSWRRLGPAAGRLAQVRPDLVVVNADYAGRADPGSGERAFYDGLADGSLGYAPVFRRRARPLSLIDTAALQREGPGRIWSNLDKVDPEIVIYRRTAPAI